MPACRSCALPLPAPDGGAAHCLTCRVRPPAFDRVISPFLYEGPAKVLVTALKYSGRTALAGFLGKRMACVVREQLLERPLQMVLPVPLHPSRQRERTFNQAALLARALAKELRLPCRENGLIRRRFTQPQTGLRRGERARNLQNAFEAAWEAETFAESILLVDDVLTTGATAGACARLLKQRGVRFVAVAAACRG